MKLSNKQLVDSVVVLNRLTGMNLNIKVSYAVARNIAKIDKEVKVYNDERAKLLEKYCVKDEEGKLKINEQGDLNIKEECLEDWNKDINQLMDIENEVDIHLIDPCDLEKCNCDITPGELIAIDYMFR
ncbi:hypothetical protein JCM1393_25520 [Clostridium carnis]